MRRFTGRQIQYAVQVSVRWIVGPSAPTTER